MKKRPDPPGHYLFTYHLCAQMHPTTVINKFVPTGIEHLVNQPLKKADRSTLARSSCIPYNGNFPLMKENHMKNTKFVIHGQAWLGEANKQSRGTCGDVAASEDQLSSPFF